MQYIFWKTRAGLKRGQQFKTASAASRAWNKIIRNGATKYASRHAWDLMGPVICEVKR